MTGSLFVILFMTRFPGFEAFAFQSRSMHTQEPILTQGQDSLQFVEQVRRFVAEYADDGLLYNPILEGLAKLSIAQLYPQQLLDEFDHDNAVISCAMASKLMVRILLDNGIDAYTYSFGFACTNLTHTVVLVKLSGKLYVYDPFLNYSLLDEQGGHLDILTLLESASRDDLRMMASQDTVVADMLVDEELMMAMANADSLKEDPRCRVQFHDEVRIREHLLKFRVNRCYQCMVERCDSFIELFETKLRTDTALRQFHQGYLLKVGCMDGAEDWPKIDRLLNEAIERLQN